MASRLVLGRGAVANAVIGALAEEPGDLLVVDGSEATVDALVSEGITARHADPTDASVLESLEYPVDTVLVVGDDPVTNRNMTLAARTAYPGATIVTFLDETAESEVRITVEMQADRVIHNGSAVSAAILERVGDDAGRRLQGLRRAFAGIDGTLGVFMHDNPDPDAIASALALCELASAHGVVAEACYFGEIAHQENRALVNLLELSLRNLDPEEFDPEEFDAIALVDHARPGVNDQLPPETAVDIVVDHHPPRDVVEAGFVDLREDAGATSTLLVDYYRRLGIDPSATVATALLYGIRVDTRDFDREVAEIDFEAAAFLIEHADIDMLERVENPSVSGDTLDVLARAIRNREQRATVLVSGVGRINHRDSLAQAADQLLSMEGVTTTLVCGILDDVVYASARTRGSDLDIGEAMREAFDQIGSAGGHADMAGAQLPLGILGEVGESSEPSLDAIVAEVVTNRFFEVVGLPPEARDEPADRLEPNVADEPAADATEESDGADVAGESGVEASSSASAEDDDGGTEDDDGIEEPARRSGSTE